MNEELYRSDFPPQWCPGCGMYHLLASLRTALGDLYEPQQVILATGIGQTAKLGFSVRANLFNGLHGRALPLAMGMGMANRAAKILAVAGDGDLFAEGGNHFIHAMRRNLDVTVVAGDNRVYGLTKGQGAPTSAHDFRLPLHRDGEGPRPINPAALALVSGATFVARAYSGHPEQLTVLLREGLGHRGLALIDVLFPCVSFNRINTVAWYEERVRPVAAGHDRSDLEAALRLALGDEEEIPTGILYRVARPVFADRFPALDGEPLVRRAADWRPERVREALAGFR